jgi:peptidoglycan glycosyltransferase
MSGKRGSNSSEIEGLSWRAYQAKLKRDQKRTARKHYFRRHLIFVLFLTAMCLPLYVLINESVKSPSYIEKEPAKIIEDNATAQQAESTLSFKKNDIHHFITSHHISHLEGNSFEIQYDGNRLFVQTSIDLSLQNYLTQKLDQKNSSQIGIVVMDPADGRLLAMVGLDKSDPSNNPCVDSSFPAASIFKIITAAAAIEKCNLNPDTELNFNGRRHTLYKYQLTEKITKYTNKISLKDAFARSVNPVFGKLGALYLGKDVLESYSKAFGFYRIINFEIFLPPSLIVISDEPYQLAEIACGFNQKTRISPVHGALLAATVLNQGSLIEPTIIDRIIDEKGVELYRSEPARIGQAFDPKTSNALLELMKNTIRSGTVKRTFRRYRTDKVLSTLEIGGKTGSINNRTNDVRYDWFVGFAREKEGDHKVALSVLVAHQQYIGTRASQYAAMVFRHYFKN